jgi:hypothetical protein
VGINSTKTLAAHKAGNLSAQLYSHILQVIRFEITVVSWVKIDHAGKDFTHTQLSAAAALARSVLPTYRSHPCIRI